MKVPGIAGLVPFEKIAQATSPQDFVSIRGQRVFVSDRGKAANPVLVCLHGFASSSESFRNLIPLLEEDFRCLAIDLNGFGSTERPASAEAYHVKNQAALLRDVLARKSVTNAIFLGHSYGAAVATVMAHEFPELVSRLVLCNPPSDFGAEPPWYLRNPAGLPIAYAMVRLLLSSPKRFHKLSSRAVYREGVLTEEISDGYRRSMLVEGFRNAFYGYVSAFDSGQAGKIRYEDIVCPALVVSGEFDEVVLSVSCRNVADSIPGSVFHEIAECGHCTPEERPEELADLIRRL